MTCCPELVGDRRRADRSGAIAQTTAVLARPSARQIGLADGEDEVRRGAAELHPTRGPVDDGADRLLFEHVALVHGRRGEREPARKIGRVLARFRRWFGPVVDHLTDEDDRRPFVGLLVGGLYARARRCRTSIGPHRRSDEAAGEHPPYDPRSHAASLHLPTLATVERVRWVIDGNNVYGSRPDGWWNDRDAASGRFAQRVAEWCRTRDDEVTLVFDAPLAAATAMLAGGNLRIVEARRRGRNAADDEIVTIVAEQLAASDDVVRVVTSDRGLRGRLGDQVEIVGVGAFRDLIRY